MQQHKMSRNVPSMHFELFVVSGCTLCADFYVETLFQFTIKQKNLQQNINSELFCSLTYYFENINRGLALNYKTHQATHFVLVHHIIFYVVVLVGLF